MTDEQKIHEAMVRYRQAMIDGDPKSTLADWAEDAVWMRPMEPAIEGLDAIAEAYQTSYFDLFNVKKYDAETQDLVLSGDLAVERSTFCFTVEVKASGEILVWEGKYIIVWRRQQDGSWKVGWAINNPSTLAGYPGPSEE